MNAPLATYREPLAEWFRDFHTNGGDYPIDVWREDADELLASPVMAQIVADAKAEAWAEGYRDEGPRAYDPGYAEHANPYRIARTPTETDRPEGASA